LVAKLDAEGKAEVLSAARRALCDSCFPQTPTDDYRYTSGTTYRSQYGGAP
jgi:hypothetical protein